jgi:hypothetical protein
MSFKPNIQFIKPHIFNGLIMLGKAFVFLIPWVVYYFTKERTQPNNIQEINMKDKTIKKEKREISFIKFILFVLLTIKTMYFFVPNNTQRSLGILIRDLYKNGYINDNINKILRSYEPHNLKDFIIFTS